MRYHALAADYDGTLAHHGHVEESTLKALRRLKETGRKLVLVTGRELDQLMEVFPEISLFDRVVAENGALLYRPETREEQVLAVGPPVDFVERLQARGVRPISIGRVIVATCEPHEMAVLEVVRGMGLKLQVIFNKGAVMVLPSGVNKATGLVKALDELGISPHNVVGVGDAENDHAFLDICECSVAVSNALDSLRERVDWVTEGDRGRGIVQIIKGLESSDLAELEPRLTRHHLLIGSTDDGREVRFPPSGGSVMVAGTAGSDKSRLTMSLLERLVEGKYQFVLIDSEGEYGEIELAVVLGDPKSPPSAEGVENLLASPEAQGVAVNLMSMPLNDRRRFSDALMLRLQELRARTGRPHWIIVDDAHHLMPSAWAPLVLPRQLGSMLYITVHPECAAPVALESVGLLLAIGANPEGPIRAFCQARGIACPEGLSRLDLERGEALAWFTREDRPPFRLRTTPPRSEHRRHGRKCDEGDLRSDRRFLSRGSDGALNLRPRIG